MLMMLTSPTATIKVHTYKDLLGAWKLYGGLRGILVDRFILDAPITPRQLRRLHRDLRAGLEIVGRN